MINVDDITKIELGEGDKVIDVWQKMNYQDPRVYKKVKKANGEIIKYRAKGEIMADFVNYVDHDFKQLNSSADIAPNLSQQASYDRMLIDGHVANNQYNFIDPNSRFSYKPVNLSWAEIINMIRYPQTNILSLHNYVTFQDNTYIFVGFDLFNRRAFLISDTIVYRCSMDNRTGFNLSFVDSNLYRALNGAFRSMIINTINVPCGVHIIIPSIEDLDTLPGFNDSYTVINAMGTYTVKTNRPRSALQVLNNDRYYTSNGNPYLRYWLSNMKVLEDDNSSYFMTYKTTTNGMYLRDDKGYAKYTHNIGVRPMIIIQA